MKKILALLIVCFLILFVSKSFAIQTEYFFDIDPGFGNGISLSNNSEKITVVENILHLSPGGHIVYLRSKNDENNWGSPTGALFWIKSDSTQQERLTAIITGQPDSFTNQTSILLNIWGENTTQYKYKLNNDNYSNTLNISEPLQITNLSDGFHNLSVIAQDISGNWQSEDNATTISWTIDTKAAIINGLSNDDSLQRSKTWNWSTDESAQFRFSIDQTNDSIPDSIFSDVQTASIDNVNGKWYIHVQAKDHAGNISSVFHAYAHLEKPIPEIVSAEYFFDIDPGEGHGFPFSASELETETGSILKKQSILGNLGSGGHTLYIRAKNSDNYWGPATGTVFWVTGNETQSIPTIVKISGKPTSLSNQKSLTLTVSGENLTHYKYKLDTIEYSESYTITQKIHLNLSEGPHTLWVIGCDTNKNWQPENNATTISWTVDTTPPIITGLSNDSISKQTITWNWETNEPATFSFAVDQQPDWNPSGQFSSSQTFTQEYGNNKWYLHVQARDNAGNLSEITTVFAILDNKSPEPGKEPVCISHTINKCSRNNIIEITWQAEDENIKGYAIQWDTQATTLPDQNLDLTECHAISPPLPDHNQHYAHIRSVDLAGNWSQTALHFGPFCIDVKNTPPTPAGLEAFSTQTQQIRLMWDETLSPIIFSYNVYRSEKKLGQFIRINPFPVYEPIAENGWHQIYRDKNVINGMTYWYKVAALSHNELESDYSSAVSATPQAKTGGNFRIHCLQKFQAVGVGDTAVFDISILSEGQFQEKVLLSATSLDLPPQVIRSFTESILLPSANTRLLLNVPYATDTGDYHIKLDANSQNRSHEYMLHLKIVKPSTNAAYIYSISAQKDIQRDDLVNIYGQIIPIQPLNTDVTISIQSPSDDEWQDYTTQTDARGFFHFQYCPTLLGEYFIKSSWIGNENFAPVESEPSSFNVGKGRSRIQCSTLTQDIQPGSTVDIQVQLRPEMPGIPFELMIIDPTGMSEIIKGLITKSEGKRLFTYTLDKDLPGIWKFKVSWAGNEDYLGAVSVPMVLYPGIETGEALIIAGGGIPSNRLWKTTETLCNKFYEILSKRRFNHDQIMYISDYTYNYDLDGDDIDEIIVDDNSPSVQDVKTYIESLYKNEENKRVSSDKPLIIYMMDHGGEGQFKINQGEILKATDLNIWLNDLQNATKCEVILIVEACKSGTFISKLVPGENQKRILISSSNMGPSNYDQDGEISFSQWFFNNISQGNDFHTSFYRTSSKLSQHYLFASQSPQIIDSESGELALQFYIGGTGLTGNTLPEIITCTPSQVIKAGSFPLFAQVEDLEGVERTRVSIIPPNVSISKTVNNFETPVLSIETIDLTDTNNDNIYKADHTFQCNGTYVLTFLTRDINNNIATCETRLTVENGINCTLGDVNGDQKLTLLDAIIAMKVVSGIFVDDMETISGDVNGDKQLGLAEIVYVLQMVSESR